MFVLHFASDDCCYMCNFTRLSDVSLPSLFVLAMQYQCFYSSRMYVFNHFLIFTLAVGNVIPCDFGSCPQFMLYYRAYSCWFLTLHVRYGKHSIFVVAWYVTGEFSPFKINNLQVLISFLMLKPYEVCSTYWRFWVFRLRSN